MDLPGSGSGVVGGLPAPSGGGWGRRGSSWLHRSAGGGVGSLLATENKKPDPRRAVGFLVFSLGVCEGSNTILHG